MKKTALRTLVQEMRRSMAFEDVRAKSLEAQKRLAASRFFKDAKRLALYASFSNEVLTDELLSTALEHGKEVSYPMVVRDHPRRLKFFRVRSIDELSPGSYEIREPKARSGDEAEISGFELIVVPGVAFDCDGARLGYGKGYYDMALKDAGCPVVALAYDFQVLKEKIPVETHDVPVGAVVTEKRLIEF